MRITVEQYNKIKEKSRLSKDDIRCLENGIDPVESEERAQEKFANFLKLLMTSARVVAYSAIPADTYTPFKRTKSRTKRIGYNKGLPDMLIVYRNVHGEQRAAFVEMKRERLGRIKPEQKKWLEILNGTIGISAHICKGFDEASALILSLIGTPCNHNQDHWNIATEITQ